VCVLDDEGRVLARGRVSEGVEGVGHLHAMVAEHAEEPTELVVGIEIDRGLLVTSLVEAGYRVYAVNPFAVSRYRDRHATSGAKSDQGDAKVLADLVRTDRQNHREVRGRHRARRSSSPCWRPADRSGPRSLLAGARRERVKNTSPMPGRPVPGCSVVPLRRADDFEKQHTGFSCG